MFGEDKIQRVIVARARQFLQLLLGERYADCDDVPIVAQPFQRPVIVTAAVA